MWKKAAIVAAAAMLGACAAADVDSAEIDMSDLSARTLPVARAVHFAVLSGQLSEDAQGDEVLRRATAFDPGLMQGLTGYRVRALRNGSASMVLVCDGDGRKALIEDAGCTKAVDSERWRSSFAPCEFTLNLATVCR